MNSREKKAYEWLKSNARGAKPPHKHDQDVGSLAYLLDQHAEEAKAEQRDYCDGKYKALALQAAKDVEHWGSYANDYFATKWGLKDDIAKYMRLATDFQSPIIGGVEE